LFPAAAGVPSLPIWPPQGNPDLEPAGSPGVVRRGERLEFIGTVPWVGKQALGEQAGRRVSFGAQAPEEEPEPKSWLHYSPDGITKRDPQTGTTTWSPLEFERKARIGWFLIRVVQDLLIVAVFFFVLTMLLRFKRADLGGLGPLRVLARCLVPAGAYSGILAFFGSGLAANLSVAVFLLVLGMNALLFVMGAESARDEPLPFDV
jgi:hypothetical protein